MGKLVDRIAKVARQDSSSIGFLAAGQGNRTLGIVVHTDSKAAPDYDRLGVEGLLLAAPAGGLELKAAVGAKAAPAELDFSYLSPGDPAETMLFDSGDRVLQLAIDVDDETLRDLSSLNVEAISVALPANNVSVKDLARLQRIVAAFGRPAIVEIVGPPLETTLQLVRDAAAAAILVSLEPAEVATLIETIETLPKRRRGETRGLRRARRRPNFERLEWPIHRLHDSGTIVLNLTLVSPLVAC